MMKPHKITVTTQQKTYPIYIGHNLLQQPDYLLPYLNGQQVMIVTNTTVADLYLESVEKILAELDYDVCILPDGEQYKTASTWQKIIDQLAANHHHRDTTIVALGGGVMSDMAGFAAACYQRGVGFIVFPTTLLSQVDASVGGKTAINHTAEKNLIGAFYQPNAVIIDVETLKTLPQREFHSGIAEIIKSALIDDSQFFSWLEQHIGLLLKRDEATLITAIEQACTIKRNIVCQDETEHHCRALLNLGHTFGHALEKLLGYGQWLHGEAVAAGLVLAAKLSVQRQWLAHSDLQRIIQVIQQAQLPVDYPEKINSDQFIEAMQMDKKIKNGQLHFILLKRIGNAVISNDVSQQELRALLH